MRVISFQKVWHMGVPTEVYVLADSDTQHQYLLVVRPNAAASIAPLVKGK
jgi:hypothetical protein